MSETRMCSLDSSTTASGIALFVNGELKDYKVLTPKTKAPAEARIFEMARLICETLNEWNPSVIYAETPQGRGGNVKLARQLGEVLGVILGWASSHNCTFEEANPSVWRKWVYEFNQGGKSRDELKAESIRVVKKIYSIETKSNDLSDAILIGTGMLNYYESLDL